MIPSLLLSLLLLSTIENGTVVTALAASTVPVSSMIDLQSQHAQSTPSQTLNSLASACTSLGIESFDVYGDFDKDVTISYLRRFEKELANTFQKEDAVFMPSGTMAQSITLLIHSKREESIHAQTLSKSTSRPSSSTFMSSNRFACHHTSHLLLWEEEGYENLAGMSAMEICTKDKVDKENGISVPPMRLEDVIQCFESERRKIMDQNEQDLSKISLADSGLTTLIIELPHRELGGKLTPWEEVNAIGDICHKEGIKYHCDGARIFEASAGYERSLASMAKPFDSIYISFYKGLGGISGAALMGDEDFCAEARRWLSRFGGNLYTLLPYAVSSWDGWRKYVANDTDSSSSDAFSSGVPTFIERLDKLKRVLNRLSVETFMSKVVSIVPEIPEVNMVRIYFKATVDQCNVARDYVADSIGVRVFSRIREIKEEDDPMVYNCGYGAMMEFTMGEENKRIDDDIFVESWGKFASKLMELMQ